MIVDPDFLDHWRTRMLADLLADELAPIYVIRIWSHCQLRRSDRFEIPENGLKALCKFPGDGSAFEAALISSGFVSRDGSSIFVPKWAEKNASLIAAWENGALGGRKKKPMGNPTVTHGKPTGSPSLTHAEPIREEKRREEVKEAPAAPNVWSIWDAMAPGKRSVLGKLIKVHGEQRVAIEVTRIATGKPIADPVAYLNASLSKKQMPILGRDDL